MFKKKILLSAISVLLLLGLAACGNSDVNSSTDAASNNTETTTVSSSPLSQEEFEQMFSSPKDYKGKAVDFYAKIFTTPEKDEDGIYLQAYADPKNSEHNILIGYTDKSLSLNEGDYIHVTGTVKDEFVGENMLGGEVKAPVILAQTVEISDYITVVSPTLKTVDINKTIEQNGYVMTVNKVEFADEETRFYMTIENKSESMISFYDFNSKLTQGSTQYEVSTNYEADYPKINSEILPGIKSEGIITFEKIDPSGEDITLIAEGSSDNYDLDFKPFTFQIPVQ